MQTSDYERAGVHGQTESLSSIVRHLGATLRYPDGVESLTDFGDYASVLKLSDELAIAFSTDGVGSKTMIASALDRYDTIGFDCVAMNVNDVLCVGARPIAMVDYLAVNTLDSRQIDEIVKGLGAAAKEASIAVPGGELAQLPGLLGGAGDRYAFDLVGACVGVVHPERVVRGEEVEPGDALIGVASSGIHSNGLTLARAALLERGGYDLDVVVPPLSRSLGDELLEPTEIYVRAVTDLWSAGIETRGLVHVTGDGLTNLCRLRAPVGYEVDALPTPSPIFEVVQVTGEIDDAEMYRVFNMGVGFVVVVRADDAERALESIESSGYRAQQIGRVIDEEGIVRITPLGLTGRFVGGESSFSRR